MYGTLGGMHGKKHTSETRKKLCEVQARLASNIDVCAKRSMPGKKNPMYGRKGESCPVSKLTQAQANEIRVKLQQGEKLKPLSVEYGVSRFTIARIRDNVIYVK